MSSIRIEGFQIDDENEEKFATHHLSARQVIQILDNVHIVLPNKKGFRGVYLILGKDNGGGMYCSPGGADPRPHGLAAYNSLALQTRGTNFAGREREIL